MKASSLQKAVAVSLVGVTGSLIACAPDNSFQILPATERGSIVTVEERKVDLLWVVDNSVSMEPSQDKLRKGFASFARKYLRPDWDIRTAVITTDMYIAHPSFAGYLARPSKPNFNSEYLGKTFGAAEINPVFDNPTYGPNYARLLPGIHDGPIVANCYEGAWSFFTGPSNCRVRDAASAPRGVENCIQPRDGESAVSQCVNTVSNDTVHSGKAILSTKDGSSIDQLIRDFTVNASVGTTGLGSERAFSSIQQLIADNETSSTSFFRKGSLRIIVFLADEDDQSVAISAAPSDGYSPFSELASDCARKTPDGYSYAISYCPKSGTTAPSEFKKGLDSFFAKLDGASATTAATSYFVVPIVIAKTETLKKLHDAELREKYKDELARTGMSLEQLKSSLARAGTKISYSHDLGHRYLQLVREVGNRSFAHDIDTEDYSPVLDKIGLEIVTRFASMMLKREPTSREQVFVDLISADGSRTRVPSTQWELSGKVLTIQPEFLLKMNEKDSVEVYYQPKTVF